MEIWITRDWSRGILLEDVATPDELKEDLESLKFAPFHDEEEIKVEITTRFSELSQLLKDIQKLVDLVRDMDYEQDSEPDLVIKRLADQKLIKV